ncbi:anthrone oxygenase family protein [Roseibacillus persicicus]|uniref:anthrone oxygenase family protein n=1 Tax=Roseibacillus persicicus TaxID=454148 RepID=UPI00398ACBB6
MTTFSVLLTIATLGCSLVAGITLIFAIVIMPGLQTLGDRQFLEAFKAIDRVIQHNQPLFMIVWLGSGLALIATTVLGFRLLEGIELVFLIAALLIYIPGVQITTAAVNVPLNNRIQEQEFEQLDDDEIHQAATDFGPRWIFWNNIRTWLAMLTSLLLLVILLRL